MHRSLRGRLERPSQPPIKQSASIEEFALVPPTAVIMQSALIMQSVSIT
jgi:hypothetical protein